jgi:hypothetical protein
MSFSQAERLDQHLDLRFIHYAVTSVYFGGEYTENDRIDYGCSRDHRPDAKQVNLGVNVTSETGVPFGYLVLAGRTADRTAPPEKVKALRDLLDRPELRERERDYQLVSDRAMLDREVIAAYAQKQIRWLGPLNADQALKGLMESILDEELEDHPLAYRPVAQPTDEPLRYSGVLRCATVEYEGQRIPIQVLVVKSQTKVKLDQDRRQTYLDRLTGPLEEIQGLLNTRRYKRQDYAWTQIEKTRRGNPAKSLVDIELTGDDGLLRLTVQINQEKLAQACFCQPKRDPLDQRKEIHLVTGAVGSVVSAERCPSPVGGCKPSTERHCSQPIRCWKSSSCWALSISSLVMKACSSSLVRSIPSKDN